MPTISGGFSTPNSARMVGARSVSAGAAAANFLSCGASLPSACLGTPPMLWSLKQLVLRFWLQHISSSSLRSQSRSYTGQRQWQVRYCEALSFFCRERKRWRYPGSFILLSDDLALLPALANLISWYLSVKSRSARFPSIPCCLKELGTI